MDKQISESYTPQEYQQHLEKLLTKQQKTIECHTLGNGERVWVRRADSHNKIWLYHLLGLFAKLFQADALTPVPNLGGNTAIENESVTLQRLAQHNILVPNLLAKTEQALMMSNLSDMGDLMGALLNAQTNKNDEELLERWENGVEAISTVHVKGQYLSQCFARNMMVCPNNQIGFIDFEDDPRQILTLPQCQTRDWLCYLHSTAFLLDSATLRKQGSKLFQNALDKQQAKIIISQLVKNTNYLAWLRYLKHKRWGRDTLRLAAFMKFISVLKMC